jgi:hypothetical protein
MAFKYTFKLKADASPHMYVNDIKRMIDEDGYLHPMMKNVLLLLKKTRMPYVILATQKEVVFVPESFFHFERAIEPTLTEWVKVKWCEEEKQAIRDDAKKFFSDMLGSYKKLGYEISEKINIPQEELDTLNKLTIKQDKAQDNIKEKK